MLKAITFCLLFIPSLAFAVEKVDTVGFLVIAPDRGFMGNEEVRDAFEEYNKNFNASLVFITREETGRFLREGIALVEQQGARRLVVVPMFLSEHHPLYKHALAFFDDKQQEKLTALPTSFAETMSNSYLIAEILADRIATLSKNSEKEGLVLVTQGVFTDEEKTGIENDLKKIIGWMGHRYQFGEERVIALRTGGQSSQQLERELSVVRSKGLTPVLIPFDLAWKADGMMSLGFRLHTTAKKYNAVYDGTDITPHPNISLWLAKQSNRYIPITKENLGVVFMPHGSNYNWNRTMMEAITSLESKYMIEPAFSMGDPLLIERAVRRLEQRGARAVVVVRVFSLASSFKEMTEYVLGLRENLGHAGHGHAIDGNPPPRVRSGCALYTVGGIEASPLFAQALLDRALEVSKDPKNETIILLAHGTESEEANKHWESNLASIASHMHTAARLKAKHFRDIQYATWREDWPQLREKAIKTIRSMVEKASEDGGTAIVIPARTTRGGREEEWLKGLNYVYNGNGFAPHPMFERWVEEQILIAMAYFNKQEPPAGILSRSRPALHQHSGKQ